MLISIDNIAQLLSILFDIYIIIYLLSAAKNAKTNGYSGWAFVVCISRLLSNACDFAYEMRGSTDVYLHVATGFSVSAGFAGITLMLIKWKESVCRSGNDRYLKLAVYAMLVQLCVPETLFLKDRKDNGVPRRAMKVLGRFAFCPVMIYATFQLLKRNGDKFSDSFRELYKKLLRCAYSTILVLSLYCLLYAVKKYHSDLIDYVDPPRTITFALQGLIILYASKNGLFNLRHNENSNCQDEEFDISQISGRLSNIRAFGNNLSSYNAPQRGEQRREP